MPVTPERTPARSGGDLTKRIVRLQPRESSFHVAVDAFRTANLDVCLNALHSRSDAEAATLRARALLRLGQEPAAAAELCAIDIAGLSNRVRGELRMLAAAALGRSGKREEARRALDESRGWAHGSGAQLASEFEYYDFQWHFAGGDYAAARASLTRGLEIGNSHGETEGYISGLPAIRARHRQGLAAIESAKERYEEAARHLRDGLEEIQGAEIPDAWTEASLISNLATLVRDLDLADEADLRERLRSVRRNAYLMPAIYQILRSLGWCRALRGDHLGAFRDLREAGAVAFAPSLQLIAAIDRTILAQGLNQQLTARDELERCQDLAARIDWDRTQGDERLALLFLAQTLAPVRVRAARSTLERYQRIRSKLSPMSLAAFDRRLRADERYTEGVVAKAEANETTAVRAFLDAFEIWEAIGYRWRAALAAIELAVLTKDSRYAGYAAAEAVKRPGSWLAERLRTVNESAG